jgi:hypothetical protein
VESAVKTAKRMMKKTAKSGDDQCLALLDIRNTPTPDLPSPAQRFLNRRTRSLLPMTSNLLEPQNINKNNVKCGIQRNQTKQAFYYDKNSKDLSTLEEGDTVRMKPFTLKSNATWEKGTITKRLDDRSYQVETDSGSFRRNRVHLRKTDENSEAATYIQDTPTKNIANEISRNMSAQDTDYNMQTQPTAEPSPRSSVSTTPTITSNKQLRRSTRSTRGIPAKRLDL